jgi:hypothetical protein
MTLAQVAKEIMGKTHVFVKYQLMRLWTRQPPLERSLPRYLINLSLISWSRRNRLRLKIKDINPYLRLRKLPRQSSASLF